MKRAGKKAATPKASERRSDPELREVLEELVGHVRDVARNANTMGSDELAYAQERLEWLADEVWRIVSARM